MKILWVKADKLLPVRNGGNIRTYHILRYLSARHDVTFLTYYGGKRDPNYESAIERELPGALSICTEKKELSGLRRGIDYLAHLKSDAPYAVSRFADDSVRRPIEDGFQEKRFDVAVCDFLDAAVNFPERLDIPTVLFQHNVESEIWRRHAETAKDPVRKAIYRMEFRKMLSYEQRALRRFQHVIAVSENDRSLMSRWVDPSRITVVPTGVDLSHYAPGSEAEEKGKIVTFIGAMDWEPNVDGVEFFCSEIWPQIRKAMPEAKFRIVGRNPGSRVQRWASDAIEVTGEVPSVLEYLHEASAVVVPLRIGGGTRLKIYEAMAAGKAVVSTTVGAEGLDVQHGRDIILADDAGSFAQAVITLLREQPTRQRYGKAAAETAARYDWSAIGHRFEEVLQSLAAGPNVGETAPARLA
jgi:glycosyltransferase involved in cell wall biosynthesis